MTTSPKACLAGSARLTSAVPTTVPDTSPGFTHCPAAIRHSLATVALLLGGFACAEPAPIVIGLAGPLSDPVGAPMRLAAEMAIEEINATGGIDGRRLALRAMDDHGHPDSAVAVARTLASSAVVAVIGHVWSSTTLAAAPIYGSGSAPVALITPSSSAPGLTANGPHLFRVCPNDLAHGHALASWARNQLGVERAAVVYRNDDYGRGIQRAFRLTFLQRGGELLGDFPFLDPAIDVAPYLDLLAREGRAQVLVIGGDRLDALAVLAQLRTRGLSLPLLGGDGLEGIEQDGAASEGMIISTAWLPDGRRPAARAFLNNWARRHPGAPLPNQPAAATYDVVHLLAATLRQSGADRAHLLTALATVGSGSPAHEGVTARIGFTPDGDLAVPHVDLAVVQDGRLVRMSGR